MVTCHLANLLAGVGEQRDFKTFYAKALAEGLKKNAKQYEIKNRVNKQVPPEAGEPSGRSLKLPPNPPWIALAHLASHPGARAAGSRLPRERSSG